MLLQEKFKKETFLGKKTIGIVVSKFKDKRDIFLLSTRHKLDIVDTGNQSNKKSAF